MDQVPSAVFRFKAKLGRPEGTGTWTFAPVPHKVSDKLARGNVRVKGTLDGQPFQSTLLPAGDGTHILVVNAGLRKALGKEVGQSVKVEFDVEAGKPHVPVPAELRLALSRDPAARERFETMPPSHRREYASYIAEAKRPETREARLAKALEMIRAWKRK